MKILFLASEVVPYSKTGGLADVAGALPAALAALGHEVLTATPLYAAVNRAGLEPVERALTLRFPFGPESARFLLAHPGPGHRVLFVGNDHYFARPGLYGDPRTGDYPDNHRRFAFFSMAALSGAQVLGFEPDIVHLNDWQTGLAAVALRRAHRGTTLRHARSVFTVHNLAYQGIFPRRVMNELGLPWELFTPEGFEFYDQLSFLKAGLVLSDALTTVSPRYAKEIQTPEAGWGLDGLLRVRAADLHGILNGIDVREWNPSTDPHLPAPFDAEHLEGKARSRDALLGRFSLEGGAAPLFGIVSRLVEQKGWDILLPALASLLDREEVRLVALGSGDPRYVEGLRVLQERHPGKVGLQVGYDEALAHLIEAGSDFFLMPSQFEPCGLNQLYSLRYGTVPIVRAVGGLDDTVSDVFADPERGNGIKFGPYTVEAMSAALERALALYADASRLAEVRRRGMRADFSWSRSAREYESLYRSLEGGMALTPARKAK